MINYLIPIKCLLLIFEYCNINILCLVCKLWNELCCNYSDHFPYWGKKISMDRELLNQILSNRIVSQRLIHILKRTPRMYQIPHDYLVKLSKCQKN